MATIKVAETKISPYVKNFWTDFSLSDFTEMEFTNPLSAHQDNQNRLKLLGEEGQKLVQMIFSLGAVIKLTISRYQLQVIISEAVIEWREIERGILKGIAEIYQIESPVVLGTPLAQSRYRLLREDRFDDKRYKAEGAKNPYLIDKSDQKLPSPFD